MSKEILFTHQGYKVALDNNHHFHVEELDKSFDTANQAKEAIDELV